VRRDFADDLFVIVDFAATTFVRDRDDDLATLWQISPARPLRDLRQSLKHSETVKGVTKLCDCSCIIEAINILREQ
jgi:hypothetical protein